MEQYKFSLSLLDQHIEKIGIDMRPQIDIKDDATRIQDFYREVSEEFPKLFEILVHSPAEFQIKKSQVIPGKAKIEIPTFVITPRGPVFIFPKRLAPFDHEFSWTKEDTGINDIVIKCLRIFQKHMVFRKCFRIGKVWELIFDAGKTNSNDIIRNRFAQGIPEGVNNVGIRWNDPVSNNSYNCKIEIAAMEKHLMPQSGTWGGEGQPTTVPQEYGIQVNLDVNNQNMDKSLESQDMEIILKYADTVFSTKLLNILNRSVE